MACEDVAAEELRPELVRIARSYVRDQALVDDVVQEALLEAVATLGALRNPAAIRTWLRLLVRKHADRATRRLRPTVSLDLVAAHPDLSDGPDRLTERRGDIATVRRALEVAADADALLLRLRYLGEWTDAELADLVQVSPGTVRKRLHDARRRLRAAVAANPTPHLREEPVMTDIQHLIGRTVAPEDVPEVEEATVLESSRERLETGIKILDAVLPIQRGGTVDLIGPDGLGQLVLVAEIAVHVGAVIVAAGADQRLAGLVEQEDLHVDAIVINAGADAAAAAADRAALHFARGGRTVLLTADEETWAAGPPTAGVTPQGGSITAFRFAPHPRDGEPTEPLEGASATLTYSTSAFVDGHYPALDVVGSRSILIESQVLDPITVGTARAAREAIRRGEQIRAFLAQPLVVGEPFTGIAGEQIPAREATEGLAELVR